MQEMRAPEYPIFKRQDAELPGMSVGILHLAVSSGWVTVVMVGNIIIRYNIANPRNIEREYRVWSVQRFFYDRPQPVDTTFLATLMWKSGPTRTLCSTYHGIHGL